MRLCAIVPVFNNAGTLDAVVGGVCRHVRHVVVVDDGSTDGGPWRLEPSDTLEVLTHDRNRGKGAAVKTGIARARELGFTHVLQVDADAQHDLDDIPRFIARARAGPETVFAGERIFDHSTPAGSRFGREFGMFWYRLETRGHPLADTQCGFRVYPLSLFERVHVDGDRMDFDVEVLVRAVWDGTPVEGVETSVRYFSGEDRVTHFRPFWDNVIFSWLHCRLTIESMVREMPKALGGLASFLGRGGRRP